MSALNATAIAPDVSLVAATAKTVLQLSTPANHRVRILGISIFFSGTDATAAKATVNLTRQTNAGTMSAVTIEKTDTSISETVQTAATQNASVEPTPTGGPLRTYRVSPVDGLIHTLDVNDLIVGGGTRLGVIVTAPAVVDVTVELFFEE